MIPVFKPKMNTEEILNGLRLIFEVGWIGLGPKTAEFEEKFADYIGVKYAIGVNSATSALHLANHILGLKPDDEVIVPSMTFVSTALSVMYAGGVPVFADVLYDTLCIDPNDIERKITSKTKAIIPVHYGGHACLMDEIIDIASKNNLVVIEDVAHGCGGKYKNEMLGSIGSMGCFSFHAVKNLPTGDGGMITTNDKNIYNKLKELRWVGINKDTWDRSSSKNYAWQYSVDELGFKYHMNDITAIIGLAQLKILENDNQKRRDIAKKYNEALTLLKWLELPVFSNYTKSACHNYVIKTPMRNELNAYLGSKGISTGVHYEPIHHYKVFRARDIDLPMTENLLLNLLTLPMFPDLSEDEIERITSYIIQFGEFHSL